MLIGVPTLLAPHKKGTVELSGGYFEWDFWAPVSSGAPVTAPKAKGAGRIFTSPKTGEKKSLQCLLQESTARLPQ